MIRIILITNGVEPLESELENAAQNVKKLDQQEREATNYGSKANSIATTIREEDGSALVTSANEIVRSVKCRRTEVVSLHHSVRQSTMWLDKLWEVLAILLAKFP